MSKIAIRPYFSDKPNLGLEKYKQVVFQGVGHKLCIWAKEDVAGSSNVRFITGLNEFAPELSKLSSEEKEAKIKQIRTTVTFLEGALASNQVDPKDKKFWDNVKMIRPDNNAFWNSIQIIPSNNDIFLDPTEPEDIIKIAAIEAGGFPEIAPSLEAAKTGQKVVKFYLDKFDETVVTSTKQTMIDARADAELINLFDTNLNKLNYICKAIDVNSTQYKKSTPPAVLFGNMNTYIRGKMEGTNRKECAQHFLEISKLDMETLKLRALVKDASFYRFLTVKNGQIYEGSNSDTPLGYNVTEVVEFLKNPLNEGVLKRLLAKVEKYWND